MVDEYASALRIPRNHYKHLEKLKYEEIMEQKNKIIAKMIKRYGVDRRLPITDPTQLANSLELYLLTKL